MCVFGRRLGKIYIFFYLLEFRKNLCCITSFVIFQKNFLLSQKMQVNVNWKCVRIRNAKALIKLDAYYTKQIVIKIIIIIHTFVFNNSLFKYLPITKFINSSINLLSDKCRKSVSMNDQRSIYRYQVYNYILVSSNITKYMHLRS